MEEHPELTPAEATKKAMEPDHRADHRHHPGAALGLRADGLHPRHLRPAVPAVRGGRSASSMVISAINALTLSPALCAVLADGHHGPKRGPMGYVSARHRQGARRLCRGRRAAGPGRRARPRAAGRRAFAASSRSAAQDADRLPAGGGPGRLLRRGAAARGRLGQPHARGGASRSRQSLEAHARRRRTSSRSSASACSTALSAVEQRLLRRDAEAVRRSARAPARRRSSIMRQACCGEARAIRAAQRHPLQPAADHRPRHRRRLRVPAAGPGGPASPAEMAAVDARRWSSPPTRTRALQPRLHDLRGQHAAALSSTSTATRRRRSACRSSAIFQRAAGDARRLLRQRLQPVRPHLAGQHPGRGSTTATRSPTSTASTSATRTATWCRCARFAEVAHRSSGRRSIIRYNNYRAVTINGEPGAGPSAPATALAAMEQLSAARRCRAATASNGPAPRYQEKAGGRADQRSSWRWRCCSPTCSWSALYESWTIPVPVLLSVAVGVLGAHRCASWIAGLDNRPLRPDRHRGADRAGRQERHPDRRVRQGAARARACRSRRPRSLGARLRFRAVMMTSFAFILGLIPLVVATGRRRC